MTSTLDMARPADYEQRRFQGATIRALSGTLTGHAAVFNSLSEDLGGFKERIRTGTFSDSIARDDIRALWNHDPNFVLGRKKNGTLRLSEDSKGLAVEITPPPTEYAKGFIESVRRGDVDQMSFGFVAIQDRWIHENGRAVRELLKVKLFDVSPVTFPAYEQTDVTVARRSMHRADRAERELQAHHRRLEKLEREVRRDNLAERLRLFVSAASEQDLIASTAAELASLELNVKEPAVRFIDASEADRRRAWGWAERDAILHSPRPLPVRDSQHKRPRDQARGAASRGRCDMEAMQREAFDRP